MKRLLALLLILSTSSIAFADNSDEFNIRLEPISVTLFGVVGAGLDIKIADQWTLGPELMAGGADYSSGDDFSTDYKFTVWAIGARANWFKNGAYTTGLYVGPALDYMSIHVSATDNIGDNITGNLSSLAASCVVGYGWFWNSFNMMVGGGLIFGLGDTNLKMSDSTGDQVSVPTHISGFKLDASVGWTF